MTLAQFVVYLCGMPNDEVLRVQRERGQQGGVAGSKAPHITDIIYESAKCLIFTGEKVESSLRLSVPLYCFLRDIYVVFTLHSSFLFKAASIKRIQVHASASHLYGLKLDGLDVKVVQ